MEKQQQHETTEFVGLQGVHRGDVRPLVAEQQSSATAFSSSPSHEFSFAISLHQSSPKSPENLSPADEIFFHGHLLPLHLLSHLPVSPRSSTNSLESFTLPIKEFQEEQTSQHNNNSNQENNNLDQRNIMNDQTEQGRSKSRSFSLTWPTKWRKGYESRDREEKEKHWKKLKFDVAQVVKRYMRMVRPLLSFRGRNKGNLQFDREKYSYSGHLNLRGNRGIRGTRGEYSAPASMRTSPTNSGILFPPATSPTSSSSDSTMEELQAAIQAAIAHCKKSIAVEDD